MIPYSTEAFLEVLFGYNQAIWPGQLTAFFLCALLLGLLLYAANVQGSDRAGGRAHGASDARQESEVNAKGGYGKW